MLENIEYFPLDTDTELSDYYMKIAKGLQSRSIFSFAVTYNDRYYVQKIKPLFINQKYIMRLHLLRQRIIQVNLIN